MNRENIGKKIRELRILRNMSLEQLSDVTDVSERALYSYELGERIPKDEVKIKIAKALGSTVSSIFFEN